MVRARLRAAGRHPPLGDRALGVLANHTSMPTTAVVVAQRAVGERVGRTPRGSRTVPPAASATRPRSLHRSTGPARSWGRCRPKSRPTLRGPAVPTPGYFMPGCLADRRRSKPQIQTPIAPTRCVRYSRENDDVLAEMFNGAWLDTQEFPPLRIRSTRHHPRKLRAAGVTTKAGKSWLVCGIG